MEQPKISERERKCLKVMAEHYGADADCTYMKYIAEEVGLEYTQTRRAVRSLARKGLAEYVRGLFNDEGMVAGSGYRATRKGALMVNACVDCRVNLSDMTTGQCSECWHNRPCATCGKKYRDHKLVGIHMEEFVESSLIKEPAN